MPLTCVIVALAAHALTDLGWAESFLLGALLSPTDPVLSSSVVTNPRVPRVVRHSLNLESGLNDGLALPGCARVPADRFAATTTSCGGSFVLQDVTLGFAFGIAMRPAGRRADAAHAEDPAHQRSLYGLGVAFATYGVTVALPPDGNGLIAVFVCAITLAIRRHDLRARRSRPRRRHRRDGQARHLRRLRLAADVQQPVRRRLGGGGDRRRDAADRAPRGDRRGARSGRGSRSTCRPSWPGSAPRAWPR